MSASYRQFWTSHFHDTIISMIPYIAFFLATCFILTDPTLPGEVTPARGDTSPGHAPNGEGIRIEIYRYTGPSFKPVRIKGAVQVVDTPGHRIEDAVDAGFSVRELASIVALKLSGSIPVTEPFESRIAGEVLKLGGNAFQIQETVADEHTGMIAAVFAHAYRIEWNGWPHDFLEEIVPDAKAYNLGTDGKASRTYNVGNFTQVGRILKDREKKKKLKEKREAALMKLKSLPYYRMREKILKKPGMDPVDNPELRKLSRARPKEYRQFKRLYLRAHGKPPPEDPRSR